MSINLRKLDEDQLWNLYGKQIENASEIKREIQRRLSAPYIRAVPRNKRKQRNIDKARL